MFYRIVIFWETDIQKSVFLPIFESQRSSWFSGRISVKWPTPTSNPLGKVHWHICDLLTRTRPQKLRASQFGLPAASKLQLHDLCVPFQVSFGGNFLLSSSKYRLCVVLCALSGEIIFSSGYFTGFSRSRNASAKQSKQRFLRNVSSSRNVSGKEFHKQRYNLKTSSQSRF